MTTEKDKENIHNFHLSLNSRAAYARIHDMIDYLWEITETLNADSEERSDGGAFCSLDLEIKATERWS